MRERMLVAMRLVESKTPERADKAGECGLPGLGCAGLDRQARHFGVTRQALIKLWIAERLVRVTRQPDLKANSGPAS